MATQTQQLTIELADDSAKGFTSVEATTHQAFLVCEDNAIRWRSDAEPTASVGTPMSPGDNIALMGSDYGDFLRNFKIINQTPGQNGKITGAGFSGLDRA